MTATVRTLSSECPSPAELHRFLSGQPCEDADAVQRHFLACSHCLSLAESDSADDALVRAVRTSTFVPRDQRIETLVDDLVRRVAVTLAAQSAVANTEDASDKAEENAEALSLTAPAAPGQIPTPFERTTYPFLAPPQQPDELGRLGEYRILQELGVGGMGIVFRADHATLNRLVALKVIRGELAGDPKVRGRFLREAQTAAAIQHDHVVSIYEFGEDGGVLFLVMPLLEGESLHSRLERDKKLPVDDVLRIGCEIAEALAAAHELTTPVIHRDIKPSNVWLEGKRARVKVLDFGLARLENDLLSITESGALIGTPKYMSPEQADDESVGPRADLFSLGVILYEMTTGELPFPGKKPMAVLNALANRVPPPPCQQNPEIPEPLSALIMRLLEKNPANRPASARVVADELRALQGNVNPTVPRIPAPEVQPTSKSRRGFAWVATVTVLAALLVMAPLIILYYVNDQGELVVEADDKAIEVLVTKAGVTVQDTDGKQTFLLRPGKRNLTSGKYLINVTNASGLQVDTEEFTITRAGRKIIHVTVRAPKKSQGPGSPALEKQTPKALAALATYGRSEKFEASFGDEYPGHGGDVWAVAISPDGKWVATAGWDRVVRVWDAKNGRPQAILEGHTDSVHSLAFAPDGSALFSGGKDGTILVWDLSKDQLGKPAILRAPGGQTPLAMAFSKDGETFATAHAKGAVQIWDWENGQLRAHGDPLRSPSDADDVTTLAFAPDGQPLASGSRNGTIRIWNLVTHDSILLRPDKPGEIFAVAWSPDGQRLASGSNDNVLRLWQVGDKPSVIHEESLPRINDVRCLAFTPDGTTVVFGGYGDTMLGLLELRESKPRVRDQIKGSFGTNRVNALALSRDGKVLVTGHQGGNVLAWNMPGEELVERWPPRENRSPTYGIAFSPDGKTLAISGTHALDEDSMWLWRWKEQEKMPPTRIATHANAHSKVAFYDEGRGLCASNYSRPLTGFWTLGKGPPSEQRIPYASYSVAASSDGKVVAVGGVDGIIRLFDVRGDVRELKRSLEKHKGPVGRLAFSRDGKKLASSGEEDHTARVWDLSATKPQSIALDTKTYITALALSPDGTTVALGDNDGTVRLWDYDSVKKKEPVALGSYSGQITGLAFSLKGKTLAIGVDMHECPLYLWDVGEPKLQRTIKFPTPITAVSFSPDGKFIATGNHKGSAFVVKFQE